MVTESGKRVQEKGPNELSSIPQSLYFNRDITVVSVRVPLCRELCPSCFLETLSTKNHWLKFTSLN